ncbi:MAG: MFS transporter, partial [Myxococcota bacterium]
GRRIVLVVGSIGMTIALLLHGLAFDFTSLLFARFLAGSCSGLLSGASIAYIGDAFPFERRGFANGVLASAFAAGQIFGIPAGAFMGEISVQIPFVAFGAFTGIAATLIFVFVSQPDVELTKRLSVGSAIQGYVSLLKRRAPAASVVAYTLMFLGVSLFITYLPTELSNRFDVSATQVATLFMVGGVANMIVGPLAGALSDRVGRKVLVVGGSTCMGLLLAATPWMLPVFWAAYPLFFIVMVFVALRISPMQALVTSLVPAKERGSLLALDFAIGQVGFGMGSLIAGVLYTQLGFWSTALAGGLLAALMAVVVGLFIPEPTEDLDNPEKPEPAAA